MITVEKVLKAHTILIQKFGGSDGIRDLNLLKSAINRPYTTFGGQDLYPTAIEKAAAVGESLITNHPFVDGNKRTGYFLMRFILKINNLDLKLTEDEKYDFVIEIASGKKKFDDIKDWLLKNTVSIS